MGSVHGADAPYPERLTRRRVSIVVMSAVGKPPLPVNIGPLDGIVMPPSPNLHTTDNAPAVAAIAGPERSAAAGAATIGFVPELESFRGIGALMVAVVHASNALTGPNDLTLWTDPRSWTSPIWNVAFWLYRALNNGIGALNMFFVLSGFVLASSIERGPKGIWPAGRHFFIGRIFRLYPAVMFSVLLFCIIFWTTGRMIPGNLVEHYRFASIVRNMLLIDWNINGVMWSLQVEAVAIPLIFAVTIGQARFGGRFTFIVGLVLLIVSVSQIYGRHLIAHGAVTTYLYAFVFGVGTHLVGRPLLERIGRNRLPWLIALLLTLFWVPRACLGPDSRYARFAECVVAVGFIALVVYGPKQSNLKRILNWPLFRFYGRISYSFYLLHPLSFLLICAIPGPLSRLVEARVPAVLLAIGLAIFSIAAVTPIAWLSWRYVEIPGIALGRRISPDRRNASPYVGPRGSVITQ